MENKCTNICPHSIAIRIKCIGIVRVIIMFSLKQEIIVFCGLHKCIVLVDYSNKLQYYPYLRLRRRYTDSFAWSLRARNTRPQYYVTHKTMDNLMNTRDR